ncbi:MAG: hypothetical protein RJA29_2067 [Pseudomonadota bacterium]|jgi:hypothetical protein
MSHQLMTASQPAVDGFEFSDVDAPLNQHASFKLTASQFAAIQARALAEDISFGAVARRWISRGYFAERGRDISAFLFE